MKDDQSGYRATSGQRATPLSRPATAAASSFNRSRVSNGKVLLEGVDGRSAGARRYRDLIGDLSAELGPDLGSAERLQVRAAAALQLHAEELAARIVRGEPVSSEEVTRATNAAMRALNALRRAAKPGKHPAGSAGLRAYLEAKEAQS